MGRAADRIVKEDKRRARAAEAFRDMLRATKGIDADTSWDDATVLLAGDRDSQAVSVGLVPLAQSRPRLRLQGFHPHPLDTFHLSQTVVQDYLI